MLKSIVLSAIAFCSIALISQTFALTESELEPSAIRGKILRFSIENATAPFATTGSWTGKFEKSPADGFTVANVTGDTVASNASRTFDDSFYNGSYTTYYYKINSFASNVPTATLTLWIWNGAGEHGQYDLRSDSESGEAQVGTFTIEDASVPDIGVRQIGRGNLIDDKGKVYFGKVGVSKHKKRISFVIKNTGTAKLQNLRVKMTGANKSDFKLTAIGKKSLGPGEKVWMEVTFDPSAQGRRKAAIRVFSNDPDESPFDMTLVGIGK